MKNWSWRNESNPILFLKTVSYLKNHALWWGQAMVVFSSKCPNEDAELGFDAEMVDEEKNEVNSQPCESGRSIQQDKGGKRHIHGPFQHWMRCIRAVDRVEA
ncbi:MAG: hypothetical protein NTX27_05775 [Verrucomicrobia bacterium]|nr:hypothetical protein [Verrucomicrobiota bacterium]